MSNSKVYSENYSSLNYNWMLLTFFLSHYSGFLQTLSLLAPSSSFLICPHSLYHTTLLPFSFLRYLLILLHPSFVTESFGLIKTSHHHNKEKECLKSLSVRLPSFILILAYLALLLVMFSWGGFQSTIIWNSPIAALTSGTHLHSTLSLASYILELV